MTLAALLTAYLFLQLAASALGKAFDPARAHAATARLLGPASAIAGAAWPLAALAEAGSAAALLVPGWTMAGTATAAVIWLTYAGAAGAAWLGGERQFDCGCTFGGKGRASDVRLVSARAGALALLAMLLTGAGAGPVWHDLPALAGALAFISLATAASQLLRNRKLQGSLAA